MSLNDQDELIEFFCFPQKNVMQKLNKAKPLVKQEDIGVDFYATVVNIISPGKLYITSVKKYFISFFQLFIQLYLNKIKRPMYSVQVDRADEIKALFDKMQQFEEKKFPEKQFSRKIFYPHLQMACSVYFERAWCRGRIEARRRNCVVEVFLVDIGKYVDVEWRFIRALHDQFKSQPEGVTLCSLVDIAPKDKQSDWSADAITELKRLCKNKLKANVCETISGSIYIELFIVKKTVCYQINAYLAQQNLVKWIGDVEMIVERPNDSNADRSNESAMSAAIMKQASQREFRQTIKILDVISPDNFHITLVKWESAIKKMHNEIQNEMKSNVPAVGTTQWKLHDHCLVLAKLSKVSSWYRGRIVSTLGNNKFIVFLRDHGQEVIAVLSEITEITPSLGEVFDGAIKCHLANTRPTSSTWAKAAIDEFKHMTKSGDEYDHFSVSVYGERKDDSFPVYLWGQKKPARDDPLLGTQFTWKNINEIFASSGYADCLEKFKTIVDCDSIDVQIQEMTDFNIWHTKLLSLTANNLNDAKLSNHLSDDDDLLLKAELDPDAEQFRMEKVVSWPAAKPICRYDMSAFVTYVDNNAVIYLHQNSQADDLKQIKFAINKVIAKVPYDKSYKWKVDEPCMVQYHADKCFYRGVIKEAMPNKPYKVGWFFVSLFLSGLVRSVTEPFRTRKKFFLEVSQVQFTLT